VGERDGDDLAALPEHGQGAVAAFETEIVDIRAQSFRDAQPVDRQQADQGLFGGGAESGRDQQRTDLVTVQPDHVRVVIQPGSADVRGRGMLQQVFLNGVPVEAGDGAQPARDRRPGPSVGLHVPPEAFDVRPLRGKQMQSVLRAPRGVLPQIQRVRLAGQPAVAGQEAR
jgi:hypothetical protein